MGDSVFIGFVGEPDFHDGSVISVDATDDSTCVRIRGASGREFVAKFVGVTAVRANSPEGMFLYALSELRVEGERPVRRFVFANWDEENSATLEIDAEGFTVFAVPS